MAPGAEKERGRVLATPNRRFRRSLASEFDMVKTVGVRVVKDTTGVKGDVVKIPVGWC